MPPIAPRADPRDPSTALPPSPVAPVDAKQAVRMRRFVMASATYLTAIPLMLLAHALGFVALGPTVAIAAAVVVVNGALYLLFKTGLNLRFPDPSLTWPQIVLATATVMAGAYVLDRDRSLALVLCPVLLMYGVFRFTTRKFITASVFVLASYAVVVALLFAFKPATIDVPM